MELQELQFEISNPLEQRIFDVFSLFDFNEEKLVNKKDVGTILRFLGCVPPEQDIQEIIRDTEYEKEYGTIHVFHFVRHIQKLIRQQKMKPKSPEILMKAMRTLNPSSGISIPKKLFFEKIKSSDDGEPFSEDELQDMVKLMADPNSKVIKYIEVVKRLKVKILRENFERL